MEQESNSPHRAHFTNRITASTLRKASKHAHAREIENVSMTAPYVTEENLSSGNMRKDTGERKAKYVTHMTLDNVTHILIYNSHAQTF